MTIRAVLLQKNGTEFSAAISAIDEKNFQTENLGPEEVIVRLHHSTLNYKDALAITNRGPVVRTWPMVAGIDGTGEVVASTDSRWKNGDFVVVNGWGLGETNWGCLSGMARLKGDWLIALPKTLSSAESMAIGTAGYTAMLSCLAIRDAGIKPDDGEILVTGATGGVGSIATSILSCWGYKVIGSTGKAAQKDYLLSLGAEDIVDRNTLAVPGKPLQRERWAAVVDSVGSHTLMNACAQTKYGGVVTACGLAQGLELPGTVAPFILRGVSLLGIDSVMCPTAKRQRAWDTLASDLNREKLKSTTTTINLDDAISRAAALLDGRVFGRTVVSID